MICRKEMGCCGSDTADPGASSTLRVKKKPTIWGGDDDEPKRKARGKKVSFAQDKMTEILEKSKQE